MAKILKFQTLEDAGKASVNSIFPERQLLLFSELSHAEEKIVMIGEAKYWATLTHSDKPRIEFTSVFEKRFERILEAAGDFREEIDIAYGYAEAGYTDPDCGVICLANWNNKDRWDAYQQKRVVTDSTPSRIAKLLEKIGVELEWSDEWSSCPDCGKIFRNNADSLSWSPSYAVTDDAISCANCWKDAPSDLLDHLHGNSEGLDIDVELGEAGYVEIHEADSFQWDKTKKYWKKALKALEIESYIFFNPTNTLWIHRDECLGKANFIRAKLDERSPDFSDNIQDLYEALKPEEG
jgi:hypothetical protein